MVDQAKILDTLLPIISWSDRDSAHSRLGVGRSCGRTEATAPYRRGGCGFRFLAKLYTILCFRFSLRLPLHVTGGVFTALREWNDVIDNVAASTMWISGLSLELLPGSAASFDVSILVASNTGISF